MTFPLVSLRKTLLSVAIVMALSCLPAYGQGKRVVDDGDRVTLPGAVPPQAMAAMDQGLAPADLHMERVILVLAPRPGAVQQREKLMRDLHDPSSSLYHQWITPEEYGLWFGISDDDLAAVTGWLQSYGFTVEEIGKGRGWLNFSGTAIQVEQAFHTQIHQYFGPDGMHTANAVAPSIPRALADIVVGLVSLHDFRKKPQLAFVQAVDPNYTSGGSHYLAPADFATIYNVNPLYSGGIDGTGQIIAIVGRTDININDVHTFRNTFGLPANDPIFVHNGPDPGNLGGGEETEADLDVQWSGAVAKNATIKFVISASTQSTDGVDLSAQYIVDNNLAVAMSTSFGLCEQLLGAAENTFYNNLWFQAATQGITSFISSGDNGAAGCDSGSASTGTIPAVNGLSSTPYNVSVGGTQFMDTPPADPSLYWAATNDPTTKGSALSYIPEMVWNESGSVPGGSGLWSGSGGASTIYAKPSWQVAPGVPADGKRDLPDVSLSAAGHDGYLVFQGGGLFSVGGTSASSPSFAGLMGLIVQQTGNRQGNANTVFYPLGNSQYGSAGPVVYHDTTVGNNTVPGVTGFNAAAGYDQASGLGSVDATALANNWNSVSTFYLYAAPDTLSVARGNSGNVTVSTTASGGFNNAITLSASGMPAGVTAVFVPNPIAAPGSGSSTMTLTVGGSVSLGTYNITVTATGGSVTQTAIVKLTVTAADFTVSAAPSSVTVAQGNSGTSTITTTISGGFSAGITLSTSALPSGVTAAFVPNPIAAPGSGTSTLTFTASASAAVGTTTVTITGLGGGITHTTTVQLTVTQPDFTVSAAPSSVTVAQGGSGTSTITTTISGGFNAGIMLSTSALPSGVTAAFAPNPIAAPGSGTSTLTFTATASAALGTTTVTITGVGGGITHTTTVTLTVQSGTAAASSIWSNATPAVVDAGADSSVELGVKFTADIGGTIQGIRFYKAAANTGTHIGSLWDSQGHLLATATFTGETASGWQQVTFSSPVTITANTVYVASYHTSVGHYSLTSKYFATSGADNPPLHAPASGAVGGNGVYKYGASTVYPANSYNATNYCVDIVFAQ